MKNVLTENKWNWWSRMGWDVPDSAWELGERLSLKQSIAMVCGDGRVMHQKCCGLHHQESYKGSNLSEII